jgi:quercetin dioxygenase-like cupin family protein
MNQKNAPLNLSIAALFSWATAAGQEDHLSSPLALTPDEIEYVSLVNGPIGVQSAVPLGDLFSEGIYVLRNKFPPNYRMPSHKHSEWRIMSVVEGTLYFAYGDTFDDESLKAYRAGSIILEPPDTYHYFRTGDEGALLQFVAAGPLTAEFAPSVQAQALAE